MADNKRIDEPTGTETVGHEWDGIEELNTPLPRWWLWTFYATVVWALVYVVLYPAIPMLSQATEGVFGWSSRGQLADEMAAEDARRGPFMEQLAITPVEKLVGNEQLLGPAIAGGAAAFKVHCVQCHGSTASGSEGFPNLTDDEWLWGGTVTDIEYTIRHGVRQPESATTRTSEMPAFGRDGILDGDQISAVVGHVLSFSGNSPDNAPGAELFANNCAICHGENGQGLREFGAPSLNDAVWLYGSGADKIRQQVMNPRHGVMPAWEGQLDTATIKMLTVYVHSLGGGEEFTEVAGETPVSDAPDEQS